ncbi:MAG: hypothetical protein Q7T50_01810 [Candidatus Magasanikbacteria bacterium]|nr:hypothetical protein [Candidatus Magasanikbacteria bacterium]
MFCPNCGWDVFWDLIGGCCRYSCVYCGAAVNCRNQEKTGLIKETEGIVDPAEAARLRAEYNRLDERRLAGERNLQKHRVYIEEERKKSKNLVDLLEALKKGKVWRKPLVFKQVSLEELKEMLKKRKEQK